MTMKPPPYTDADRLQYVVSCNHDRYSEAEVRRIVPDEQATMVSSELKGCAGYHSPILDIDFPARLVPSTTPGHFHLYLDGIALPWKHYARLLRALERAGILEPGYVEASLKRRATHLWKAGWRKPR